MFTPTKFDIVETIQEHIEMLNVRIEEYREMMDFKYPNIHDKRIEEPTPDYVIDGYYFDLEVLKKMKKDVEVLNNHKRRYEQ